jgi:hypothetical protein
VGVVKRRVLRGLWRRLVGVGIIGQGLLGAPAFILSLAARFAEHPSRRGLRFGGLSTLREASGGATMTTPGGAGTTLRQRMPATSFVLGASASIMGSEFPQSTLLRPFVADRNICHFLWYGGVAGDGLRSVGEEAPLLIQERVLYPAHRHLRAGALRGSGPYNPFGRAVSVSPIAFGTAFRFAPPLRCAGLPPVRP